MHTGHLTRQRQRHSSPSSSSTLSSSSSSSSGGAAVHTGRLHKGGCQVRLQRLLLLIIVIENCRSFKQIVQVMFAAGSMQMQWLILPILVVFANLCFRSVLFLLSKNSSFPFEQFNFLLRISSQNQTAGYRSSCCYSKWSWFKRSVIWGAQWSWGQLGSNLKVKVL